MGGEKAAWGKREDGPRGSVLREEGQRGVRKGGYGEYLPA